MLSPFEAKRLATLLKTQKCFKISNARNLAVGKCRNPSTIPLFKNECNCYWFRYFLVAVLKFIQTSSEDN